MQLAYVDSNISKQEYSKENTPAFRYAFIN